MTIKESRVAKATIPVGALTPYAGGAAPPGWLLCDGSEVSRADYVALFKVIGTTYGNGDGSTTFNLPDLRGRTTVGSGSGDGLSPRALGETFGAESHILASAEIPSHIHGGNTETAGAHEHLNSEATESMSGHKHDVRIENEAHEHDYNLGVRGTGWGSITGVQDSRGNSITFYERLHITRGDHRHPVTTTDDGGHTHDVTISPDKDHGHKFTTDGGTGGDQPHNNVPPSLVMNFIIRY